MATSEIDLDSPSIRALGPLFKLTEIFLWDDGCSSDDRQVSSFPKHIRFKYDDEEEDDNDSSGKISSNMSLETIDSIVMEDADLTQQMSSLGLPLSFQTSKQKQSGQTKGKNKATQHKNQQSQKTSVVQVQESFKVSEESLSHADSQEKKSSNSSSLSLPDQTELSSSGSDVSDDIIRCTSDVCEIDKPAKLATDPACFTLEQQINVDTPGNMSLNDDLLETDMQMEITTEQPQVADLSKESQNVMLLDDNDNGNIICCDTSGDWSAFWDSFYMRYYFYNAKTQESTWDPPPGMENLALFHDYSCMPSESSKNAEVPGIDVDPAVSRLEEEQVDRCEVVDITASNEQNGDPAWGPQKRTSEDLSSSSAELSDSACVINPNDLHVVDGNCGDEKLLSLKKEMNQMHSDDICCGNLQSEVCDSTSHCETSSRNCNGNIVAQFPSVSTITGFDDDYVISSYLEERETLADDLGMQDTPAASKRKKKGKNRRRKKSFNDSENQDFQPIEQSCIDITKYWCQRYFLFSKFDQGIKMDEEGWFSVTPEAIAIHQATRFGSGIIIDCFAGVGGNAIQFAKTGKHVIAIDIDPMKIDYARHNSAIYGVEDRIDFINGDCFSLALKLKADTVFLSPPWGGPDYVKSKSYDLSMLQPYDGQFLFDTFKVIASVIIMFLPRNVDIVQLAELALSANPPWSLEVEKNFLNGKLKAVTAYFSKTSI